MMKKSPLVWTTAVVAAATATVSAASTSRSHRMLIKSSWNLPELPPLPSSTQGNFNSQSLAAFVSKLPRGGSSGYYNDNNNGDYYYEDYPEDERQGDGDYYGDDTYSYNDNRKQGGSFGGLASKDTLSKMPGILKTGDRRIGILLVGSGLALTMLGISLFFNKTLMRLGNLLFIGGVPMTIGPGRTIGYFLQPKKARATGCLAVGIFLVFIGHPVIGILLEAFGILNLFGNLFPIAMVFLKQLPIIGPMLDDKKNKRGGGRRQQSSRGYDDYEQQDPYYDDQGYYDDGRDQDRYY